MKPCVIVWDLETVPDLGGFAAANDLVGKSDVEIREAIGTSTTGIGAPKNTPAEIIDQLNREINGGLVDPKD
jgi:hypothetical protein